MALKTVLDSLDGISEALQTEYTKRDDGKFVLAVEGDIPGTVAASKLEEFRKTNTTLMGKQTGFEEQIAALNEKLNAFSGIDVEEAKRLKAEAASIERKELLKKGDVETLIDSSVQAAVKPLATRIEGLEGENTKLTSQLHLKLVDETLLAAGNGTKASNGTPRPKIRGGSDIDVLNRARTAGWKLHEGQAVMVDGEGKPTYSTDNPGAYKSADEYIVELAKEVPHLFEGSGGGGTPPGDGGTPPGTDTVDGSDIVAMGKNLEDIASGKKTVR